MNCDEALEILWPPEMPKVAGPTVIEARRHLDTCPSCQAFLESDRLLQERLASLSLPSAPASVRERVFDALAHERTRAQGPDDSSSSRDRPGAGSPQVANDDSWRRGLPSGASWIPGVFAAAALVGLMLGGWHLLQGPDPSGEALPIEIRGGTGTSVEAAPERASGVSFVEDFVRRAVQETRISTSEPDQVRQFILRELGVLFRPHSFPEFALAGAEICIVDGKRGAVILYERDGKMLYHYVLQRQGTHPTPPTLSSTRPSTWPGASSPAVVTWTSDVADEALVGDVDEAELLELARAL